MEEKILTLHPEGKNGVNISKAKYDTIRSSILEALQQGNPSYKEMVTDIKEKLNGKFDGSVSWYVETVKLDLEARNLIRRIENRPHRYVLV